MNNKFLPLYTVVILFAFGCAQQVGPTGGPKDTKPPQIVESHPENYSTSFAGNKIKIRFNEFVQLKDLHSKLIVSPPLKELPAMRIKGKTLEISFEDTLLPNTTYNFQFGDGIVDITEGNILDSNRFVFSTGNKIDSLFITGTVKQAFDLKPEKNVTVMLYYQNNDSVPLVSRPVYFAKTTDDGTYKIQFVKEGSYKIFALQDGNSNYLFDLPDETIGFHKQQVKAGDSAGTIIRIFKEDVTKQILTRAYAEHFGKMVFVFAKPVGSVKVSVLNHNFKKAWFIEEISAGKDSLFYWINGAEKADTLKMQVSENNTILDTVEVILPPKSDKAQKRTRDRDAAFPDKLGISLNIRGNQPVDIYTPVSLETKHPSVSYQSEKIILIEKKDTVKLKLAGDDKAMRKFTLNYVWKDNTEYTLLIPDSVFTDIYGLRNDTVRLSFKTRKKEEYGKINLKIKSEKSMPSKLIVQLMDKNENIIQEKMPDKNSVLFEKVPVSSYKLKLIFDRNGNGKWDTGNYLKGLQPEEVIYYSSPVDLKPKFDLDLEWRIIDE